MKTMFIIYTLLFFLLLLLLKQAMPDPDLLTDYCVADTAHPPPLFFNGEPCINPAFAVSAHFATSALSKSGDTSHNLFGFNTTAATTKNLPGMNFQGLSLVRVDIAPGGLVPIHSHPRAAEVVFLLEGTEILVGFVDTTNRLFTQRLRPGDAFVFPRGMAHFLLNLDGVAPVVAISGLGSQNPGVQVHALAAFRSEPRIPDEVLKKNFRISGQDVQKIQKNLGG